MAPRRPVPQGSVTWAQACAFRLQRMHLVRRLGPRSLRRVARDLGGIQAQVHSAAQLQCAVRLDGLAPQAVENALYKGKTLVKTWMMRGTIHYLDPNDLPVWAAASTTRRTWNKPYWQKAFGITAKDVQAAIEIIPQALDGACLTREALADEVHRITRNAALDELMRAGWGSILKIVAAEGALCFGPNEGRNVTFTRPDQWLKEWREPPPVEEAMKEVCVRYLASHGPATREELARWWGFTPPDATRVLTRLEDQVLLIESRDRQESAGVVRCRWSPKLQNTRVLEESRPAGAVTAGRPLARRVREDVDHPARRIAKHEATHAPVLVAQSVDDLVAELECACVNRVDIIDLDRRERVATVFGALLEDADLRGPIVSGRQRHDPAQVHREIEVEEVNVEVTGGAWLRVEQIRNDSTHPHGRRVHRTEASGSISFEVPEGRSLPKPRNHWRRRQTIVPRGL